VIGNKGGTKFKQEHRSIELVSEEADISLIVHDALPERKLDFMLAGPPYGKSWKKGREAIGGKEPLKVAALDVLLHRHLFDAIGERLLPDFSRPVPHSGVGVRVLDVADDGLVEDVVVEALLGAVAVDLALFPVAVLLIVHLLGSAALGQSVLAGLPDARTDGLAAGDENALLIVPGLLHRGENRSDLGVGALADESFIPFEGAEDGGRGGSLVVGDRDRQRVEKNREVIDAAVRVKAAGAKRLAQFPGAAARRVDVQRGAHTARALGGRQGFGAIHLHLARIEFHRAADAQVEVAEVAHEVGVEGDHDDIGGERPAVVLA